MNSDSEHSTPIDSQPSLVDDGQAKKERLSLSHVLPTDRIAFEKQAMILRAFAAEYAANGGKPVSNAQAGRVLTPPFSGSTITQTNGFFCDIGIISRTDKGEFVPSEDLVNYNTACQWDEAEAKQKLRPVFEATWFYRCLAPRLQLGPQSKLTCLAVLAAESKATPDHQQKLRNLLSYLELAGILTISGDTVTLINAKPSNGTVESPGNEAQQTKASDTPQDECETHTLYLDKDRKRKVHIQAPLVISKSDYGRICRWLEVALIVEDDKKN